MNILEEAYEDFKNSWIFRLVDRMLASKYSLYFLPLIVLIDVYLLILPLEPILAVYAIKHKKIKLWVIGLVSTGVSLFGYISLYLMGFYLSGGALGFFEKIFGVENIMKAGELLSQNIELFGISIGLAALLGFTSALASIPIPLSIFTFSVGVFQIAVVPFTIMFFIGRYIRYYVSAWVGRVYGVAALEAVFKNIFVFTGLFVLSIIIILFKIF